jgi:hypothetical protein
MILRGKRSVGIKMELFGNVIICGLVFTDISDQPVPFIFSSIWTETRNGVTKVSLETPVIIYLST